MTAATVAVVPFGARAADPRVGAWGRQVARRLVDRYAAHPTVRLEPVFLVAMPEEDADPGYLVFGSTPDPALAARYGASLGATHALVGLLAADGPERRLEATLVDVAAKEAVSSLSLALPEGTLHEAELGLASWLAETLGADAPDAPAAAANEPAYRALLEGMDEEVNATLLAAGDPAAAAEARSRAVARHLDALHADPGCAAAEERLLVLAAESLERGDVGRFTEALERLTALLPRSWRGHYLLGELRRATGDPNGAIVALEHSDALHPLRDVDVVRLAELYAEADATATALARLRRVKPESDQYPRAQDLVGVIAAQRGDLETAAAAFERAVAAGTRDGATFARLAQCALAAGDEDRAAAAFDRGERDAEPSWELAAAHGTWLHGTGDLDRAIARYRDALRLGAPPATRLNLARALAASGSVEAAVVELEALLAAEPAGETGAHARRLRLGLVRRDLEERLEQAGRAALGGPDDALDGARGSLLAVAAEEPDLWEAHFALGLIARRQGDAAAAERSFRRVLELWPEQPDALHELGVALLGSERTNEAVRMLDGAARLRPDDAGYLADAGFAQLRAGNLNAARERLALASELDANDPITRSYLEELARIEAAVGKAN